MQHLGGNRPKQEASQGSAAVRRQHHQIGSLALYQVMDNTTWFADPSVKFHLSAREMRGHELLQTLLGQRLRFLGEARVGDRQGAVRERLRTVGVDHG